MIIYDAKRLTVLVVLPQSIMFQYIMKTSLHLGKILFRKILKIKERIANIHETYSPRSVFVFFVDNIKQIEF